MPIVQMGKPIPLSPLEEAIIEGLKSHLQLGGGEARVGYQTKTNAETQHFFETNCACRINVTQLAHAIRAYLPKHYRAELEVMRWFSRGNNANG